MDTKQNILSFKNTKIDPSIINSDQIEGIVTYLIDAIENSIDGDVVELGCYVGESSKYIAKTLVELKSSKQYFVYDSFEGLPDVSSYEENTGWRPGTLKTTKEIFKQNFIMNNLPCPVITQGWFKNIAEESIPQKISFAFLDGDFYSSIYDSLEKVYNKVADGGYILVHDYDRPDLPGVKAAIVDFFTANNHQLNIEVVCDQLAVICKNKEITLNKKPAATTTPSASLEISNASNLTIVTGIWDLRRDQAGEGFKRPFSHYIDNFTKLLKTEENMVIFVEESLVDFVRQHRQDHNTRIIVRNVQSFKDNFAFYEQVQKIRNNPTWSNSAHWLKDSTQATLEMYNPMVMSKFFMLHDAVCFNHFNTDYFAWIDGGITNTVHEGYFTHDKVFSKVDKLLNKLFFISFPYEGNNEIHGFDREGMNKFSGTDYVKYVCRGGFFGGHKDYIRKYNSVYYHLLNNTLAESYMGTEESIFTIMAHQYSNEIDRYMIDDNGLISKFFEAVKTDTVKLIQTSAYIPIIAPKVSLYVLTFNSPKQFEVLVESYKSHKEFITNTKNYLIDNSTDISTEAEYIELCKRYNFERIKKDNIGICGGRQFIAEHFDSTDSDYYIFLEDDMNLMPENNEVCVSGFRRYSPDLFQNTLKIINEEGYDFLKFSFSEFFGTNTTQWAWYNVPQNTREKFFPEKINLPKIGTDPNAPKTKFNNIKCKNSLAYVDGEIYYCNWPQIVSRAGNTKMFLDTKWARPYEQTWMSHMFQLTKEDKLKGALLLLSPINHHRFHHYENTQRKES